MVWKPSRQWLPCCTLMSMILDPEQLSMATLLFIAVRRAESEDDLDSCDRPLLSKSGLSTLK